MFEAVGWWGGAVAGGKCVRLLFAAVVVVQLEAQLRFSGRSERDSAGSCQENGIDSYSKCIACQ